MLFLAPLVRIIFVLCCVHCITAHQYNILLSFFMYFPPLLFRMDIEDVKYCLSEYWWVVVIVCVTPLLLLFGLLLCVGLYC